MCGISGIVSTKFIDEHEINYLKKIANYQVHRGPDFQDYKFFKNENIFFQHQRLSILDLSKNSNQPMFSKCNKYCFIFNGEIYNYKELSSLYLGYITDSDTIFLAEIISLLGIQKENPIIFEGNVFMIKETSSLSSNALPQASNKTSTPFRGKHDDTWRKIKPFVSSGSTKCLFGTIRSQ